MIKIAIQLLGIVPVYNRRTAIAKGRHKLPETWGEFRRYLKLRYNGF